MIKSEFITMIKAETNMIELAKEYGVELSPSSNNVWIGRCPHPDHNDGTPSFRVWKNKDFWSWACMGCHAGQKSNTKENRKRRNYGSDCIAFVQWMSDTKQSKHIYSFSEAVAILAKRLSLHVDEESEEIREEYESVKRKAIAFHDNLNEQAREYLHSRGLSDEDIDSWCIGFIAFPEKGGAVVPRITFPLFNRKGRAIGFSNRVLGTSSPLKYINSKTSEIFDKGSYLYGLHALDKRGEYIYITEGTFDVILAQKYGLTNTVASLGTAFTEKHVEAVASLHMHPVLVMDGDNAGQHAMQRIVELFKAKGIHPDICVLPKDKDLADMANELTHDLPGYIKANQRPYWQFTLAPYVAEYQNIIMSTRKRLLPSILEEIKGIEGDERILVSSYVYEQLGVLLNGMPLLQKPENL